MRCHAVIVMACDQNYGMPHSRLGSGSRRILLFLFSCRGLGNEYVWHKSALATRSQRFRELLLVSQPAHNFNLTCIMCPRSRTDYSTKGVHKTLRGGAFNVCESAKDTENLFAQCLFVLCNKTQNESPLNMSQHASARAFGLFPPS